MKKIIINGEESTITVHHLDNKSLSFTLDGKTYNYRSVESSSSKIVLREEIDNHSLYWYKNTGVIDGWDVTIEKPQAIVEKTASQSTHDNNDKKIISPMPGKILQINVKTGDSVKSGQILLVMEAMKMEHTIKSPRTGIVTSIPWNTGDRVEGGIILMELEKKNMNSWKHLPTQATITEVAPRDGLQNESFILKTDDKIQFIEMLADAGLSRMEVTAFVREDKIPQMKDAVPLSAKLTHFSGEAIGLVPNKIGFDTAVKCGFQSLALITAASDTFNQKNINMTVEESLQRLPTMITFAQENQIKLRVHLSTAFGCPFEGPISPEKVADIVQTLLSWNISEIVLADTIGVATPKQVDTLLKMLSPVFEKSIITLHFHDTRGMALANILTALERGFTSFDSSAGGLGGCPYAPGASGNVATEELVYLFDNMGIECGIDLDKVFKAVEFVAKKIDPQSRFSKLFSARPKNRKKI